MKFKSFIIAVIVTFTANVFSQSLYVPSGSSGIGTSGNSNIGIGTSTPLSKLDVRGSIYPPNGNSFGIGSVSDAGNRLRLRNSGTHAYIDYYQNLYFRSGSSSSAVSMTFTSDGNIGIGYLTPAVKLHIESPTGLMGLYINHQSTRDYAWGMKINVNRDLTKAFILSNSNSGKDVVLIYGNGQVYGSGFNTTGGRFSASNIGQYAYGFSVGATADFAKAYSLTDKNNNEVFYVWGNGVVNAKKIYAEAFEVRPDAMSINWYDHVFSNSYKLKSLSDVEQFIQENNHLPDIPSEKNIKANGFNMAEMDGLLLKKIEELTLYVIQQQKEIEELKQKVNNNN